MIWPSASRSGSPRAITHFVVGPEPIISRSSSYDVPACKALQQHAEAGPNFQR